CKELLRLHLATGRTRDEIEKRIWQRQQRKKRKWTFGFERKFLTRKWNPAVYLQVDDHVILGNCPAAVSSEKNRPSSYGVLQLPAELGYEPNRGRIFLHFLMNGAVI
ncbi:hypothetical protein TNCV_1271111, partial [Trichonephila clavipes]